MIKKLLILSLLALPVNGMEYWRDMSVDQESSSVMLYNYETGEYAYGMKDGNGGLYIYDRDRWYDSNYNNLYDYQDNFNQD